jgi:hypothetical protein
MDKVFQHATNPNQFIIKKAAFLGSFYIFNGIVIIIINKSGLRLILGVVPILFNKLIINTQK